METQIESKNAKSKNQEPISGSELANSKSEVMEADQESTCSSTEEVESPKSVVAKSGGGGAQLRRRRSIGGDLKGNRQYMHIQVLRIKEEELHLGEDLGEGFGIDAAKRFYGGRVGGRKKAMVAAMDALMNLSASPLGERE